jgi:site-specific DNA recombinase
MPALRAVAYYRMSQETQEASIPQQKTWAERAAAQHNAEIVRAFQDDAVAGDEIGRRAGLQGLLSFCEREAKSGRPLAAVLVWDQDRFSRANSFTTAAILDRLMTCGVTRMITNTVDYDFTDDKQRVFYNLSQDLGKRAYSKSVSQNVSRSRAEKAALGIWTGSRPPYGYVVGPDGHLMFGPAEMVETVRWIFRRYVDGTIGVRKLAAELQKAGRPLPTRKNRNGWTDDLVHGILISEAYKGILRYNVTTAGKYHRLAGGRVVEHYPPRHAHGGVKVTKSAPEDIISKEDAHPAMIDNETWEAAQRKLEASREKPRGPNKTETYPLSGLLFCSECGGSMYGIMIRKVRSTLTWKKYICSKYLHRGKAACHHNAVLESDVLDSMSEVLARHFADDASVADTRARLETRRRQRDKDMGSLATRLRKRVKTLADQIDRATQNQALARGEVEFRRVGSAIETWEKERDALAAELAEAERQAEAEAQQAGEVEEALKQLAELSAVLREAPPDKVARVARAMIDRVEMTFQHRDMPSGRVGSTCTGGTIHLKDDLGLAKTAEFRFRCAEKGDSGIPSPLSQKTAS